MSEEEETTPSSSPPPSPTPPREVRHYKTWKSNNEFECNGRLIHGPDRYYFWAAAGGIVVFPIVFLVLVAPDLMPLLPSHWNIAFIPVFILDWIYTLVFLFLTAYTDPGIIPRHEKPKPPADAEEDPFLITLHTPPSKSVKVGFPH